VGSLAFDWRKRNKIHKWASPRQSAGSFFLLAHLSGHGVAELLLDLLLGLGIEVG
jgi:hypothetical protein